MLPLRIVRLFLFLFVALGFSYFVRVSSFVDVFITFDIKFHNYFNTTLDLVTKVYNPSESAVARSLAR